MATISKLPSGKYRAQVRLADVYKAQTFDRKSDATYWACDIERAISDGAVADTIQPPKDMTLGLVISANPKTGKCWTYEPPKIWNGSQSGSVTLLLRI